ncbi:hypothetical protein [Motilibacter deserti]|uniref:Lipoprotein n=1 Tax=Motilibacter deserti TaxID=2714956 RepID=A0ABX0GTG8_9ACTN|nr:hypothetical protein [Motilibacter deserti]NHC12944.1 hypothetical protein [Motilibacter deserti]
MRPATAALPLAAVLVLAACGSDAGTSGAPARPADCNHVSLQGKDAAAAVGFHWTGETHAYGASTTLWFCVDPRLGGSITFEPPAGVTVTPQSQQNSASGSGVLPFTITVQQGATGRVRVQAADGNGRPQANIGGPEVEAAGDGWKLAEPAR